MGVRPWRIVGFGSKRTRGGGVCGARGGSCWGWWWWWWCSCCPAAVAGLGPWPAASCSSPMDDASSSKSRASASGSRVLAGSTPDWWRPAACCDLASAIVCRILLRAHLRAAVVKGFRCQPVGCLDSGWVFVRLEATNYAVDLLYFVHLRKKVRGRWMFEGPLNYGSGRSVRGEAAPWSAHAGPSARGCRLAPNEPNEPHDTCD